MAQSFTRAWDETDKGSEKPSTIDDLIEELRVDVRERMNEEHYAYDDETDETDVWLHRKESGHANYGLAANKPETEDTGRTDGAIYYETDTGKVMKWNDTSASWVLIAGSKHSVIGTTYATGTVDLTKDSAVITGHDTEWSSNIGANDIFKGPDGEWYDVSSVDSDTQITLGHPYDGDTAAGQSYTIYLGGHPQYLGKSGGTITGNLTIQDATIVANGTASNHAAAYGQVAVLNCKIGTYTGDGNGTQAVTGVGFQPTLVMVYEQAGGYGTKQLAIRTSSDSGTKEADGDWTTSATSGITSLDADGFTVGKDSPSELNTSSQTYTYIALKHQ